MNKNAEFVLSARVYYEDTDAAGVVYYANYLKFMERARTEWLRSFGFQQDTLKDKENIVFVVRKVEVDYHRPARFNQQLCISVEVIELGNAKLICKQIVKAVESEDILVSGQVTLACVNADTFRPTRIPTIIKEAIVSGN